DLLTTHFTTYVDYNFTAGLEEQLDQVARGELKWQPLLADFWEPFITLLKQKEAEVSKDSLTTETIEELCPECGRPLAIKLGKRGKFIACTGFKEGCTYTRNLAEDGTIEEPVFSDETCALCNKPMLVKQGRYGKYLACSGYPECKNIQPLEKPKGTGVPCPACAEGELTEKKSRYGKLFYSCNRYPDCKYALWDPPVPTPCPSCGHPVVVRKVYKRKGEFLKCPNEGCGWTSA
ncbi:MAG: topoisomerase DNA-binding C4 zinc finger domain-containing protein, partial [Trichlorobacter sp.]